MSSTSKWLFGGRSNSTVATWSSSTHTLSSSVMSGPLQEVAHSAIEPRGLIHVHGVAGVLDDHLAGTGNAARHGVGRRQEGRVLCPDHDQGGCGDRAQRLEHLPVALAEDAA